MTTTTRTAALGIFAATLAAVLAAGIMPRSVMAHNSSNHQLTVSTGLIGAWYSERNDRVIPFICVSASEQPDSAHLDPWTYPDLVDSWWLSPMW